MLAQQRHSIIMELLQQEGIVHTANLVKKMKVSSETIRKDLDYLEQEGMLVRVHGGAVPVQEKTASASSSEYISFQIRNTQHMEQKRAIVNYAVSLLKENQVIALDYGSTSQLMAMTLKQRFRSMTVITHSIQNALILSDCPKFTIILTGGFLNHDELTLSNDFNSPLDQLHIDVLFMTASGVDPNIGCTDQFFHEAKLQNQMRQSASQTILLADSSKFGRSSLAKICSIRDIDTIVTDSGISVEMEEAVRRQGTNLVIVPTE